MLLYFQTVTKLLVQTYLLSILNLTALNLTTTELLWTVVNFSLAQEQHEKNIGQY